MEIREPLSEFANLTFPKGIKYHYTHSILDSSKLQTYMDCRRKFFFAYVLGWRGTKRDVNLIFGEAWHRAMEAILLGLSVEEAYALFFSYYRENMGLGPYDDFSPKIPSKALLALEGYQKRWNDSWKVKHTEVRGIVPIMMRPWRIDLTLRIDAVVEEDDQIIIIDHKTSTRKSVVWEAQFGLSVQANLYLHAAISHWGFDKVSRMIINGAFFYKRKNDPYDFYRVSLRRSPRNLEQWLMTVRSYIVSLVKDMNNLTKCSATDSSMMVLNPDNIYVEVFRQNPKSCTLYNRVCEYHDLCKAWSNPLTICAQGEIPSGLKVERWDPKIRDFNYVMEDKKNGNNTAE